MDQPLGDDIRPHADRPASRLPSADLHAQEGLPFSGHPTIGSAHAVLRRGFKPRTAGRLVQECGKGLVDIKIDGERLFLALPEPEFREPTKSHLAAVADSLCVSGADVQRAAIIDVGPVWFTVQLVSGDAIGLLGSRCRCNHSGAQDPGELQGKHRYASGALGQDLSLIHI